MKIGIDIGGSHICVGVVDEANTIIAKKEYNWKEEEKKNLLDAVQTEIPKLIKECFHEEKITTIQKIGIGFPSRNIVNGIIYENEKEVNLPYILSKEFHVPVYLKNDVKCATICEKEMGSLKAYKNSLFLTIGTGIGGAYIYQNQLVVPTQYAGFEVGHMVIQENGKHCRCGRNGCFEEYASMRVFRENMMQAFHVQEITCEMVMEFLKNKSTKDKMEEMIEQYLNHVTTGLANLIYIFEPEAISFGGSFVYFASVFMERLNLKLKQIFYHRTIPVLKLAKFGNLAGVIGASMLENN